MAKAKIKIGGYKKEIIRRQPRKQEVSIIDWEPGARTPRHKHSVREVTYVLEGMIFEIRDGRKKYYKRGAKIIIPAQTIHEVGVDTGDGPAKTLNICDGLMEMQTYPSSSIR